MSHIYLLRHAKTQQSLFKSDFDRELIEKGYHQIEKLIKKLKEDNIRFDTIISSPAKRAKQTAEGVYDKLGNKKSEITFDENLYYEGFDYLLHLIHETKEKAKGNTLIVGHNPTIEDIANHLSHGEVGHVKTCGTYKIK